MVSLDTPQGACRFGVARCDITPPVGIYHRMWGAATHDRATGVHRPLTATAMVFRPLAGAGEQILIALDHCLLWAREMDALLQTAARKAEVPVASLAITFSHTHAAGLMGRERANLPGGDLIAPYLDRLADQVADIVRRARAATNEASVTYLTGRCALASNRDFWDADSKQFVCGFNPEGSADDSVLIAAFRDQAGKLQATVVNYACHPTTLAWQNTLISPDYPGALREVVETATGAPCVFLQGASGDVGPREGFVADVATADRNGRQLGFSVLASLEALPPPASRFIYTGPVLSGATLGTWAHQPLDDADKSKLARWQLCRWTVPLPYREGLSTAEATRAEREKWQENETAAHARGDEAAARDCRAMVERMTRRLTRLENLPPDPEFPFPVILWRIGAGFWLCVEGELYNVFQRELRRAYPGIPILVTTLTNGHRPSYLPPAEVYGKGIYQEAIAILAPGCLERLLAAIKDKWVS